MNGLLEVTQQHSVVIAPFYDLVFLLSTTGGPALPDVSFRIGIPHQACMDTPLLEVHPPGDHQPDLLFPADTQRLCKNNMGEDEGPLRVPTPAENPPPFHCPYCREVAPLCT